MNTKTHTDIKRLRWIENYLPAHLRPYAYLMRLDRPIGIWLLLFPSWWSILLSSGDNVAYYDTIRACLLFSIGAIVMRGAGCVINDIWDRDLDKSVERTRTRPLAAGTVTPRQAIYFLATLLLFGLVVLLQFNFLTVCLGFLSIPLIITYPLMKRYTWWPQAFLGLTFNFGALMGWAAMTGTLPLPAYILYAACIFWTLGYDTIYAHQDKEDDVMAGIKSTAIYFGEDSPLWVCRFYALSSFLFFIALTTGQDAISIDSILAFLFLIPMLHLYWQIKVWEPYAQESSLRIFKSNRDYGFIMTIACLICWLVNLAYSSFF